MCIRDRSRRTASRKEPMSRFWTRMWQKPSLTQKASTRTCGHCSRSWIGVGRLLAGRARRPEQAAGHHRPRHHQDHGNTSEDHDYGFLGQRRPVAVGAIAGTVTSWNWNVSRMSLRCRMRPRSDAPTFGERRKQLKFIYAAYCCVQIVSERAHYAF